jgi:hypothetical protein
MVGVGGEANTAPLMVKVIGANFRDGSGFDASDGTLVAALSRIGCRCFAPYPRLSRSTAGISRHHRPTAGDFGAPCLIRILRSGCADCHHFCGRHGHGPAAFGFAIGAIGLLEGGTLGAESFSSTNSGFCSVLPRAAVVAEALLRAAVLVGAAPVAARSTFRPRLRMSLRSHLFLWMNGGDRHGAREWRQRRDSGQTCHLGGTIESGPIRCLTLRPRNAGAAWLLISGDILLKPDERI